MIATFCDSVPAGRGDGAEAAEAVEAAKSPSQVTSIPCALRAIAKRVSVPASRATPTWRTMIASELSKSRSVTAADEASPVFVRPDTSLADAADATLRLTDVGRRPRRPLHGFVIRGYTRDADAEPDSRCKSDTVPPL